MDQRSHQRDLGERPAPRFQTRSSGWVARRPATPVLRRLDRHKARLQRAAPPLGDLQRLSKAPARAAHDRAASARGGHTSLGSKARTLTRRPVAVSIPEHQ